ncbi:sialate O-acetylesterase [Pedobacter sp. V48]|uniref:sialate O-acetylesterase n=1 Tax=Pedobacter sp. V48 TaxID=509635 RepID=UPI0003E49519|nr:sialate O-acetylesterase [Pedobacter sp. V48]ETZ22614.1 hypothetical protein N824_22330 [Pedobacter sp. V48]
MRKKYLLYICVLIIGSIIGIIADRNREYLINGQFLRDHLHLRKAIADKDKVIKSNDIMIFFAFGQSNSANYGEGGYHCRNEVYNYYKGDIYKAEEPLLGPDGKGTSVWSRLGDMLIDSGLYKKVIIIPIGIGSTSIQSWVEESSAKKLDQTLNYLGKDNIKPTHIFWQQGETDNVDGTSKNQYKERLKMLINVFRKRNIQAPFYTSITSYFPYNNNNPLGINKGITEAQQEVAKEVPGVIEGPNTDSLNLAYYRYEAVHFTEKGLDRLAYEWFKKIKAAEAN